MKFTIKTVCQQDVEDIILQIFDKEADLNLDFTEVYHLLDGKQGILYVGEQETNESHTDFINLFFDEFFKSNDVLSATKVLIGFVTPENDPLYMNEIGIINDQMEKFKEDVQVFWGMKIAEEHTGMKIYVITT